MSNAVTDRGAVNGPYSEFRSVPAFTPTAGSMLLACGAYFNGAGISAISGHDDGEAWAQIAEVDDDNDFSLWGCIVGQSPSSAAVTATVQAQGSLLVVEVHPDYVGASVAASIIQSATFYEYVGGIGSPFDIDPTLNAFADSDNLTLLAVGVGGGTAQATFSPQGSLTTDSEITESGGEQQGIIASLEGEDTTPNITSTATNQGNMAIALEIANQVAGGSVVPKVQQHARRRR